MERESRFGFNPEEAEAIKKTTSSEDLEHLAELGKKALEKEEEIPSEKKIQTEVELGKAFQTSTSEEKSDVQLEEQNKKKGKDEKDVPEVKLGKAFQ